MKKMYNMNFIMTISSILVFASYDFVTAIQIAVENATFEIYLEK